MLLLNNPRLLVSLNVDSISSLLSAKVVQYISHVLKQKFLAYIIGPIIPRGLCISGHVVRPSFLFGYVTEIH